MNKDLISCNKNLTNNAINVLQYRERFVSFVRWPIKTGKIFFLLHDEVWFLRRQCLFHHPGSFDDKVNFPCLTFSLPPPLSLSLYIYIYTFVSHTHTHTHTHIIVYFMRSNEMSLSFWLASNQFFNIAVCRLCTEQFKHLHKWWQYYGFKCVGVHRSYSE